MKRNMTFFKYKKYDIYLYKGTFTESQGFIPYGPCTHLKCCVVDNTSAKHKQISGILDINRIGIYKAIQYIKMMYNKLENFKE